MTAHWQTETSPVLIHRLRDENGRLLASVIEHRRGQPDAWVSATLAVPGDRSIATGKQEHVETLAAAVAWVNWQLGVREAAA